MPGKEDENKVKVFCHLFYEKQNVLDIPGRRLQ